MTLRSSAPLRFAPAFLLVFSLFAAKLDAPSAGLIVHEWGTFTSVAGADGAAADWLPLGGPSDLPCFVDHFGNAGFKIGLRGTVRMETPVIYFYTDRERELSAKVDFPRGLITDWYPRATSVAPQTQVWDNTLYDRFAGGRIEWTSVKVAPHGQGAENLMTEKAPSHYYAARNTNAATVIVKGASEQRERFLFYRGVANFQPPLSVRLEGDKVLLRTQPGQEIGIAILFENHGGKLAYSLHQRINGETAVMRPGAGTGLDALRSDLERILVENGLFPDEAHAMVETWRDSWFEEGARVFYIFPRPLLDSALPLEVIPLPEKTERVFVGRIEVITPELEQAVLDAATRNDRAALARYGRFLEPVVARLIHDRPVVQGVLQHALMYGRTRENSGCSTQ